MWLYVAVYIFHFYLQFNLTKSEKGSRNVDIWKFVILQQCCGSAADLLKMAAAANHIHMI